MWCQYTYFTYIKKTQFSNNKNGHLLYSYAILCLDQLHGFHVALVWKNKISLAVADFIYPSIFISKLIKNKTWQIFFVNNIKYLYEEEYSVN